MELERPSNSALIRLLREAARAKPRSIGFGRDRDQKPTPHVAVIAEVRGLDAAAAKKAVADGAAAVVFALEGASSDQLALDGKAAADGCGDAVPGLSVSGEIDAAAAGRAGFDFVVANVDGAPAGFLTAEGVGRVARVDADAQTTALLRALGELQVDAVVAGRASSRAELSLLDLMGYRHVVDCLRQPVLVAADASIKPIHLQALRDVGVVGVLLSAGADIAAFRDAAAQVKASKAAGASSGGMALLPRIQAGPTADSDKDDDGDDDDE